MELERQLRLQRDPQPRRRLLQRARHRGRHADRTEPLLRPLCRGVLQEQQRLRLFLHRPDLGRRRHQPGDQPVGQGHQRQRPDRRHRALRPRRNAGLRLQDRQHRLRGADRRRLPAGDDDQHQPAPVHLRLQRRLQLPGAVEGHADLLPLLRARRCAGGRGRVRVLGAGEGRLVLLPAHQERRAMAARAGQSRRTGRLLRYPERAGDGRRQPGLVSAPVWRRACAVDLQHLRHDGRQRVHQRRRRPWRPGHDLRGRQCRPELRAGRRDDLRPSDVQRPDGRQPDRLGTNQSLHAGRAAARHPAAAGTAGAARRRAQRHQLRGGAGPQQPEAGRARLRPQHGGRRQLAAAGTDRPDRAHRHRARRAGS